MTSKTFAILGYDVDIFNTRNPAGAQRLMRLRGRAASDRVILSFLAGEPLPTVRWDEEILAWNVSFPIAHYDAILDLLRQPQRLWVVIEPPESATFTTNPQRSEPER